MPKYTLIYFNSRGLGEPTRYMFELAGVKYEDRRIEYGGDEWKKIQPTLTLGQLPILEVDGKQIAQNFAIHRFVASELDFCGPTAFDRAQVDVIIETQREAFTAPQLFGIYFGTDEQKKAELIKEFEIEVLEKNLAKLEKLLRLNKGGDGWFVGDKVSLADVQAFSMYHEFYPALFEKKLDLSKCEKFAALLKRFEALPEVAAWIKKRPQTKM